MPCRLIPLVLLLATTLLGACAGQEQEPERRLDERTRRSLGSGALIGFEDPSGALAWYGVPFAAAPVGELRWRAPRPPVPWSGTREARRFGSPCPQFGSPFGGAPADA
ncbi:MAG: carboxylesterase family protein, partial [Pseudomonadales bacterium]|nr:carboxylesterase family protein [Pseudomonadales bacterium]